MKGIILAGGTGTRLYPVTFAICKQLLPVYDKPMIYYPLSVLMLAGIRDVLIISTPEDQDRFVRLLGDGSSSACASLRGAAATRRSRAGLHHRARLRRQWCCPLILGDNIFYGTGLDPVAATRYGAASGCTIFAYQVTRSRALRCRRIRCGRQSDLHRGEAEEAELALGGHWLYFFDNRVLDIAASSSRPRAASSKSPTSISLISRRAELTLRAHGPRLCLARHRHP